MGSLVYLVRNPVSTMPRSLYSPHNPNVVVIGIEPTIGKDSSTQSMEVLRSGSTVGLQREQRLTYSQLLEVIIQAEKVITL